MHGAAHTANAPPRSRREPRERAPRTQPGADEALGPGQEPHEREPEHDQDEARDLLEQELVAEEAGAEQRRADAERHEDRGEAEDEGDARRDDAPRGTRSPSSSALTAETADRYPGTSGSTQGARNDRNPASRATGISPALTARTARALRRAAARAPGRGGAGRRLLVRLVMPPAPAPGDDADAERARDEEPERQQPGEQVEAGLGRLREHARPELVDEVGLDPLLCPAGRDVLSNQLLHPLSDRRVRLVERRVAGGADELRLEIRRVGRRLSRGGGGEPDRDDRHDRADAHCFEPSASAMPRS